MVMIPGTNLHVSQELYDYLVAQVPTLPVATYLLDGYVAESIVDTTEANYLSILEGGTIEYTPKGKFDASQEMSPDGTPGFTAKGRVSAKPGKALHKVLKESAFGTKTFPLKRKKKTGEAVEIPQLTDAVIESFNVALQSAFQPINAFIVTGEALRYFYAERNYTKMEKSTLHNSCMRYSSNYHQTRVYSQNPRTIGLLVIADAEGRTRARALLWNSPLGMLMDRVYGTDQLRTAMRNLAKKRGWMLREGDSADYRGMVNPDGKKVEYFVVPMQHWNANSKPYMDTLSPAQLHASGHFHGETADRYYSDARRNPMEYSYCGYGNPPTRKTELHPIWRPPSGSLTQEHLDGRVEWLSNFDQVPPWPEDLLRSDPKWRLPDDPEDDQKNWDRVPTRRTTGLIIERPKPKPTAWKSGLIGNLSDGMTADGLSAFTQNIANLTEAFARVALGDAVPAVQLAGAAPLPGDDPVALVEG